MIPISHDIIQPIIRSNICYVDSVEEFEQIELEKNQTILCFDNTKACFYIRDRDKYGDYSPVKIYFYETFAQKLQDVEREEFIKKCKDIGLDELKTEIACMFFLENKKPLEVWEWSLKNTRKEWEWDYVRNLKCKLKKQLFEKVIKI
jgi:hypothetical protein